MLRSCYRVFSGYFECCKVLILHHAWFLNYNTCLLQTFVINTFFMIKIKHLYDADKYKQFLPRYNNIHCIESEIKADV